MDHYEILYSYIRVFFENMLRRKLKVYSNSDDNNGTLHECLRTYM